MTDKHQIEQRAHDLLLQHGLASAPVDVDALARKLGADVVYGELEGNVSGFLIKDKGRFTIAVNSEHHPNRRRFTLAHECAHLVLHATGGDRIWVDKPAYFRDDRSGSGVYREEIQANQFAAALLMPKSLVLAALSDDHEISDLDILELANRFEVSEAAMRHRLVNLDLIF